MAETRSNLTPTERRIDREGLRGNDRALHPLVALHWWRSTVRPAPAEAAWSPRH
jgi:hypothetical protein